MDEEVQARGPLIEKAKELAAKVVKKFLEDPQAFIALLVTLFGKQEDAVFASDADTVALRDACSELTQEECNEVFTFAASITGRCSA